MNNSLKNKLLCWLLLLLSNTLSANIIYVNANADSNCNDGTSWPCAFLNLHSALNIATVGDSIWVATATYYPTATDDRNISFQLPDGVVLLGGFLGTETLAEQRDWRNNPTILSGEIGAASVFDNTYHIIQCQNLINKAVIDGFTLSAAVAGPGPQETGVEEEFGGAILHQCDSVNITSELLVNNCSFFKNRAVNGGGIALLGKKGNISTKVQNCFFEENIGARGSIIYTKTFTEEANIYVDFFKDSIINENKNFTFFEVVSIITNEVPEGKTEMKIEACFFDSCVGRIDNVQDSTMLNFTMKNSQILNTPSDVFRNTNTGGSFDCQIDSCEIAYCSGKIFEFRIADAKRFDFNLTNTDLHHNYNQLIDFPTVNVLGNISFSRIVDTTMFHIENCNLFENNIEKYELIDLRLYGQYLNVLFDSTKIENNTIYPEETPPNVETITRQLLSLDLLNASNKLDFSNVIINNNSNKGSSILQIISSANPIETDTILIRNCSFENNKSIQSLFTGNHGRLLGMSNNGIDPTRPYVKLANSSFTNNFKDSLESSAGLISLISSSPIDTFYHQVESCIFQGNNTGGDGLFYLLGKTGFANCLFSNNTTTFSTIPSDKGGVIHAINATVTLDNCTFFNNSAIGIGGAIYDKNSLINANNSIFYQNIGVINVDESTTDYPNFFNNCLIQGNDNCFGFNSNTTCTNSLFGTDPLFTNADSADFTLQPCSPAINFGDNVWLDSFDIATDLAGNPRIISDIVDAGAYESGATFAITVDSLRPFMCADSSAGSVAFSVEDGCAPYTLAWATDTLIGLSATELLANHLAAGSYVFILTDSRGNNVEQTVEIPAQPDFALTTQQADYNCENETGGSIFVSATNPNLIYDYLWNTGDTTFIIGNLLPDIYTVTVSDEQGCSAERSIAIHPSGLMPLSISVSPISCHDSADGTAAVAPIVGIAPYTYAWASGETDSLLTNLSGGMYEVTVSDAISCTNVLEFSMLPPDTLKLDFLATNVQCAALANGAISVSATGGTPEYNYLWNTEQTMANLTDLSADTYSVIVTDEKNCTDSLSITIEEPLPLELTSDSTNADCFGIANGTASVQPTGGTAPYQYFWSTGAMDSLITDLLVGTYETTVTDAQNCTATTSIAVLQPDSFNFSQNIVSASAFNAADGVVEIANIIGGTPPYFTQWNTGETGLSIDNLLPDTYTLTIIDNTGCQQIFTFEVSFMNAIQGGEILFSDLHVFPNPLRINEDLVVNFQLKKSADLTFKIVTAEGKILNKKTAEMKAGSQSLGLKMPEVSGIYFLEITEKMQMVGSWKVVVN